MRVVLPISLESWGILSKNSLEESRRHTVAGHVPHLVQQLRVGLGEATLCAKWVGLLQAVDELPSAIQDELSEFESVTQTLQTRVHVACVT